MPAKITMGKAYIPMALILSCLVAAASPEPVPQFFLVVTMSIAVAALLWRVLAYRKAPVAVSKLYLVAIASATLYMMAVYQSSPGQASMLDSDHLSILAKYLLGPVIFGLSYSQNWEHRRTQQAVTYGLIVANLALIGSQLIGGIATGHVIGSLHSNFMGLCGATGLAYSIAFGKTRLLSRHGLRVLLITSAISMVLSLSRGALVSVVAAALIYFGIGKLVRGGVGRSFALLGIVTTVLLVSVNFNAWLETDTAKSISQYSENITGKPVDTGRSKLWAFALYRISENPIYGIGVAARSSWDRELSSGDVITLSVHNYYLAVLLESGIVGLLSVMAMVSYVYVRFFKLSGDLSRFSAAVFLACLIHQTAEVSLTTGTFTAGALIWIMWGGLARLSKLVADNPAPSSVYKLVKP